MKEVRTEWMELGVDFYPELGQYLEVKLHNGCKYKNVMYDEDDNGGFFTADFGDIEVVEVHECRTVYND